VGPTAYLDLWLKESPYSCKESNSVSLARKELTYQVKYSVIYSFTFRTINLSIKVHICLGFQF
jgi:hypothetical protein